MDQTQEDQVPKTKRSRKPLSEEHKQKLRDSDWSRYWRQYKIDHPECKNAIKEAAPSYREMKEKKKLEQQSNEGAKKE